MRALLVLVLVLVGASAADAQYPTRQRVVCINGTCNVGGAPLANGYSFGNGYGNGFSPTAFYGGGFSAPANYTFSLPIVPQTAFYGPGFSNGYQFSAPQPQVMESRSLYAGPQLYYLTPGGCLCPVR
jgi:hypothetical protein